MPPGTRTLKSRTTGPVRAVLELDVLELDVLDDRGRRPRVRPVGFVGRQRQNFEHALHRRERPLQLRE